MKTKFYGLALVASALLSAPAQAGNHHSNTNSVASPAPGHARGSAPSFHPVSQGTFGGGRTIMSGQRFSAIGVRPGPTTFRQHSFNSSGTASISQPLTPGPLPGKNGFARLANQQNRVGLVQNQRPNRLQQIGNGNASASAAAGNHVFARHSADWHRDWDRHCDHWWHGHRCRFIGSSWIIFDLGFYPWYWPYDYYPYDYYPYTYDTGVYEGNDAGYYNSGAYDSSNQYADETVAAAQDRLARQGYYRGNIDGVFGPETQRAVRRYQSDHGLRVTGYLTADTRSALGLNRAPRY